MRSEIRPVEAHVARDELAQKLGARLARRLDPHRRARPRRHPAARRGRAAPARGDGHGALAARVARRDGRRRGRGGRARAPAARHRAARCRATRSRSSTAPEEAVVAVTSRHRELPAAHVLRRGLPAAARVDAAPAARGRPRGAVETVARVGRSASRDESRPVLTGILVRFEPGKIVMAATDSYRLAVKETPRRGRAARARGDHPGPRAPGARADRAASATSSSSASTRTTSSSAPTASG